MADVVAADVVTVDVGAPVAVVAEAGTAVVGAAVLARVVAGATDVATADVAVADLGAAVAVVAEIGTAVVGGGVVLGTTVVAVVAMGAAGPDVSVEDGPVATGLVEGGAEVAVEPVERAVGAALCGRLPSEGGADFASKVTTITKPAIVPASTMGTRLILSVPQTHLCGVCNFQAVPTIGTGP